MKTKRIRKLIKAYKNENNKKKFKSLEYELRMKKSDYVYLWDSYNPIDKSVYTKKTKEYTKDGLKGSIKKFADNVVDYEGLTKVKGLKYIVTELESSDMGIKYLTIFDSTEDKETIPGLLISGKYSGAYIYSITNKGVVEECNLDDVTRLTNKYEEEAIKAVKKISPSVKGVLNIL